MLEVFSAGRRANSQDWRSFWEDNDDHSTQRRGSVSEHPLYDHEYWLGFARRWNDIRPEYKSQVAVAYLEVARRNRLAEACLGVRRPPRRILSTCSGGGQQQQSNLFGSSTNANPLLGGFFGSSTLGTSTFRSGRQQLTAGSLLSSRSAGWLGQQQNDPASQHASITARFEGIYNAWNPASPQCRFQVPFSLLFFFCRY